MRAFWLFLLFFCTQALLLGQVNGMLTLGTPNNNNNSKATSGLGIANGSGTLGTTYTVSACGLDYVQFSLPLNQRAFSFGAGIPQPATYSISGIPACATILKAFLYVATVGNPTTVVSATLTNPIGTGSVFPMTMIGFDASVCWQTDATVAYRADVTALISGNGNYTLSGIPTSTVLGADDAEGATLFIIYQDLTQNYTGSIVLVDGMFTNTGPNNQNFNVQFSYAGFSVCGPVSLTRNFMAICDLQQIADMEIGLNNAVSNYTIPAANQLPWMFISQTGTPAFAGQNTVQFYSGNQSGDCYGIAMTGMYYRTACMNCSPIQPNLTLTVTATSNSLCPASVSATAIGGSGDYLYTWSGTAQTGSLVTGLTPGVYTITAQDRFVCAKGSTTVLITPTTLTLTPIPNPLCPTTVSVSVTGGAGPYTYSWTGIGNGLNTVQAIALSLGIHTITVNNSCALGSTTLLVTRATLTLTATVNPTCPTTASVMVAGAAGPYSYSWTGSAQSGSVATGLNVGIYTITATNVCAMGSTTVMITPSSLTLGLASTTACPASATVFVSGGTAPYTYTWSGSAQNTSVAIGLGTGNYTVQAQDFSGCFAGIIVAPVTASLASTTVSSPTTVCVGNNAILVAGGAASYTWSPNSYLNATNVSQVTVNVNVPASIVYTVNYKTGSCTGTQTTQVTVVPTQTFSLNNATLCEGQSLAVNPAVTGITSFWNGPNSFTASTPSFTLANVSPSLSGIYSTTITTAGGCGQLASFSLNVNVAPLPMLGSNSPLCAGNTLSLSSLSGSGTYSWTGPAGFVSNLQNPVINNPTVSASGNYNFSVTYTNSCTRSAVLPVTVLPLPQPVIFANNPVCENTTLYFICSGGPSYQWLGPNGFSSNLLNPAIPNVSAAAAGNYTLLMSIGSCTANAIETITVLPAPVINPATNTTVCQSYSLVLNSGGTGAASYLWTGPNSYTSSVQDPTITLIQMANAGNYSLAATGANGCQTNSVALINVLPTPSLSATGTTVCEGTPVSLNATGAISYGWYGPSGFAVSGPFAYIPATNSLSAGVYTVIGIAVNTCTSNVLVTLGVLPLPLLSTSGSTVCEGQSASLNANGASGYSWSGPSGFSSNLPNVMLINVTAQAAGFYTVVGTGVNSCTSSATANLMVVSIPQLVVSASPSVICSGESTTLIATGAQTYSWLPLGSFIGPILVVSPAGTSIFSVSGSNMNFCTSQMNVVVRVDACIGLNEIKPEALSVVVYPNPASHSFVVKAKSDIVLQLFNNLGQLVRILELNHTNEYETGVSDIANGVYYLVSRDQAFRQKILITK